MLKFSILMKSMAATDCDASTTGEKVTNKACATTRPAQTKSRHLMRMSFIELTYLFVTVLLCSYFTGRFCRTWLRQWVKPYSIVGSWRQERSEDLGTCRNEQTDDATADDDDGGAMRSKPFSPTSVLADVLDIDEAFFDTSRSMEARLKSLMYATLLDAVLQHPIDCHESDDSAIRCLVQCRGEHMVVQSWPQARALMIDVMIAGDAAQALETVHKMQAFLDPWLPKPSEDGITWSLKFRGFRHSRKGLNADNDLGDVFGRRQVTVRVVASAESDFQRVTILDQRDRGKQRRAMRQNRTILWDRVLYLDRVMQSRRFGDAAYHESLVHPAMLAHNDPRRVAIIGGGEGATLREVLKHNTIQEVVMVEIDEDLVEHAREYLPEWNDCSGIAGRSASCFEDAKASVFHEDAIGWFEQRYGGDRVAAEQASSLPDEHRFDVVIMDALDPNSVVEFSDVLYANQRYCDALAASLTDGGILVAQVGEDALYGDVPDDLNANQAPRLWKECLAAAGFESVQIYDDMHSGFGSPWAYLVAFRDSDARALWYRNPARVDWDLRRRLLPPRPFIEEDVEALSLLRFFDGATMASFQFPSRIHEELYCRRRFGANCPHGANHHGLDPYIPNVVTRDLAVQSSGASPQAGRGVYTLVDIDKGSYIGVESLYNQIFVPPDVWNVMFENDESGIEREMTWGRALVEYFYGYGWLSSFYGGISIGVDANIHTFVNHGCNGTFNLGERTDVTEMDVPLERSNDARFVELLDDSNDVYNPFRERHFPLGVAAQRALRDIAAGEELLDNYLVYDTVNDAEGFARNVRELQDMCTGRGAGSVHQYETNGVDDASNV